MFVLGFFARRPPLQECSEPNLKPLMIHGPAPHRPSTGSQSGSAAPGLTQVPSTLSRGLHVLNCRFVASEVNLSQRTGCISHSERALLVLV